MRLLAISVVILAGATVAGAGAIANAIYRAADKAFPRRGLQEFLQTGFGAYGMWLAGIGLLLFIFEWWSTRDRKSEIATPSGAGVPEISN